MKILLKTTISGLVLIGATVSSFGQGQSSVITWQNVNGNVSYATPAVFGNGPNAGSRVTGPDGTYEYGLYVGPLGTTDISQMTLVSTCFNSSQAFAVGSIFGGSVTLPSAEFPSGTPIADIVAGWTAADGSDYLSAMFDNPDDYSGLSSVGYVTPYSPPGQVFGYGPGQITGLTLTIMPEPGTLALGGLGAAALLLFRRKKQ